MASTFSLFGELKVDTQAFEMALESAEAATELPRKSFGTRGTVGHLGQSGQIWLRSVDSITYMFWPN